MPTTHVFQHNNSNPNSSDNWTNGVPADGTDADTIDMSLAGTRALDGVDWSAKNNKILKVGPDHAAAWGTSGSALKIGNGWTIEFNGMRVPSFFIEVGTGDALALLKVHQTTQSGLCLTGAGTITEWFAMAGRLVLDGSLVVPQGYILGGLASVKLGAGLTATRVDMQHGYAECYTDLATIDQRDGHFDMFGNGDAKGDVSANLYQGGGNFYFDAPGRTVANYVGRGGDLRCDRTSHARTVTAAQSWAGNRMIMDVASNNVSGSGTELGGRIIAGSNFTVVSKINPTFQQLGVG